MIYVYPEKNLRAYPGITRGTSEWERTDKIQLGTLLPEILALSEDLYWNQDCELVSQLPTLNT